METTIRNWALPTWLLGVWDGLRTSFWFLPAVMASISAALSIVLVQLDAALGPKAIGRIAWLYAVGPEGARSVLSAIATSMITVASLTFSITMLTLQLASSQFGHRLLRNFMRDRGNQIVLGTFTSTFLYCILVLRTVRGTEEASHVPHLSVSFGVLLSAASIAVLIYFIHHVANSIRIETVLATLAAETRATIDRLYPEQIGSNAPGGEASSAHLLESSTFADALPIRSHESGYVQRIDEEGILDVAVKYDLQIRIEARPGSFVTDRDPVLLVLPPERAKGSIAGELYGAFVLGPDRTPVQDVEFSLLRIVEVAQRALSPGVNDPQTAIYCIDRIGEALARLAERTLPSSVRADAQGQPRVVTTVTTVEDLACSTISAVARYAMQDADVVRRLLDLCEALTRVARPPARNSIAKLADSIRSESQARLQLASDRGAVGARTQ